MVTAAYIYAHKWHIYQNAIGSVCTEILQRQCGKEEIYVQVNNGNIERVPSRLGVENTEDILQRFVDFLSDVIARHIDELDMKSLPSYESLKAAKTYQNCTGDFTYCGMTDL